jgi:hypothetical protein
MFYQIRLKVDLKQRTSVISVTLKSPLENTSVMTSYIHKFSNSFSICYIRVWGQVDLVEKTSYIIVRCFNQLTIFKKACIM